MPPRPTQKPLPIDICIPKNADPFLGPLPPLVNIIECGPSKFCQGEIFDSVGKPQYFG